MYARVFLGTDTHNQKGRFDGCTQRTFGQRMHARYGANLGCAQPTSLMHTTSLIWWYGRNAGAEEYSALGRSSWEWSCVRAQSMSNCWAIETLECKIQEAKQERSRRKKNDPKQIPRVESNLAAIMRPIAQQIITDISEGNSIDESRVATAGMLMHKNPLGRDNRARERGATTRPS